MSNSLGSVFAVTTFGESHGSCVGAVIDGCPAGLCVSVEDIQSEVDRRKPAAGIGTPRAEADRVEVLSGIFNGFTTGAPVCLLVRNTNTDSRDYERMRFLPRPGHADYTAWAKYGGFNDYQGGGRFSGRITAALVMAGAVAKKALERLGVEVLAHTSEIGGVRAGRVEAAQIRERRHSNPVKCADEQAAVEMLRLVEDVRNQGDSLGGCAECLALNVPVGLGEPLFDTVEGELAKALFAIPAVKGVEFGAGFGVAGMRGSQNNDAFVWKDGKVVTETNNAGGALGGISNGMPLTFRVAIKPTPSISLPQRTVDLQAGREASLVVRGRHDACIVPRAVVVIEAVTGIVLCDLALRAGLLPRVLK